MKKKLGLAFKDQVSRVNIKSGHFQRTVEDNWKDTLLPNFEQDKEEKNANLWRMTALLALSLIIFFAIFLRLFHLQVVQGRINRDLADGNRIQVKRVYAPRGVIFDRNGKILAANSPGFRLKLKDKFKVISRDQALEMEARGEENFKNLEIDSVRSYPMSAISAHILGYIGEITPDELKALPGYKSGDRVGRGGVEETYEKILKGIDGGEVSEVDAAGKTLRVLRSIDPIPGQNLYLTIDSQLQQITYNLLEEATKKSGSCCAAAVAENPETGEILALVSYPSFNPEEISDYLNAPNFPILNRAIAGTYPPGSTFKIVSAFSGLESGQISPQTVFEDTGQIFLGPYKFSNWYFNQYGKVEGSVNLVKAIKRSNDTYFYLMSEKVGEKTLGETAKKLGLGKTLGIDIPGEANGLIPGPDWKVKHLGEVWFPGDTLHMAIGQGFVLATPIQILNLASVVASEGVQISPHLGLKSTDPGGKLSKEFKFSSTKLDLKKGDLALVREGMTEAAKSGGTAWPFFTFPIVTAGKTGTAEFGDPKNEQGSIMRYKTHAWYTSFAPADDPKIASVILIEGGGEGSSVAVPVAKEIYRWFFSEDKKNLIKDVVPVASESAKTLGE